MLLGPKVRGQLHGDRIASAVSCQLTQERMQHKEQGLGTHRAAHHSFASAGTQRPAVLRWSRLQCVPRPPARVYMHPGHSSPVPGCHVSTRISYSTGLEFSHSPIDGCPAYQSIGESRPCCNSIYTHHSSRLAGLHRSLSQHHDKVINWRKIMHTRKRPHRSIAQHDHAKKRRPRQS